MAFEKSSNREGVQKAVSGTESGSATIGWNAELKAKIESRKCVALVQRVQNAAHAGQRLGI